MSRVGLRVLLACSAICFAQQVSAQASPGVAPGPRRELRASSYELRAVDEASDPRRPRKLERQWFRGPLAASYAVPVVGLSVFAFGVNDDNYALPGFIGVVSLFAPPLVHVANGDISGGFHALLGMVTSSGVGALAGYTIGELAPSDGSARDAAIFCFVGYALWAVLDVAFFAYHDEPL